MKSSRSIWTPNGSQFGKSPQRSRTPNADFSSQFQNHSMLPLQRNRQQRNSMHYLKQGRKMNMSEMMPASMDPRTFQRFEKMTGSNWENNFNPGLMPEEQLMGALNRFSLSRANNK